MLKLSPTLPFRCLVLLLLLLYCFNSAFAQAPTRQDTLRGSNGPYRSWWDVQKYHLSIYIDIEERSITGSCVMDFRALNHPKDSLQLDLQDGMFLDSVLFKNTSLDISKEGDVWWVKYPFSNERSQDLSLIIWYHGKPKEAKNPPWDGGFVWKQDDNGKPWVAVACQGLGASSWWPCKDFQSDEPDKGVIIGFPVIDELKVISNGRLLQQIDTTEVVDPSTGNSAMVVTTGDSFWSVKNPINLYNLTFYIGDYVSWVDTLEGEKGKLPLSFYALRYHEQQARKQFAVVKPMLRCFEHWMGPYPFYEDGYKLVEAPYLGMEHQSAVAYGNKFKMGYLGRDLSGTGEGLKFDFIIIHESAHEWFGNNITATDVADNWIHEGLTTYAEALYLECQEGKDAAFRYTTGQWKQIANKKSVIGPYGVNKEGGDIYNKGSAIIHMIRLMMKDDEKFRQLLRGLNEVFYHKTVTTQQVEDYISKFSGLELSVFFDVYLRSTVKPELRWYQEGKTLFYRWENAPTNFMAPVSVNQKNQKEQVVILRATKPVNSKLQSAENGDYNYILLDSPKAVKMTSLGFYNIN